MSMQFSEVKGIVFDIQHYCIHDGPGIRTNVFVKGCPLSCLWCANPESQSPRPQLMFKADSCVGCGACVGTCPVRAVAIRSGKAVTDRTLCTGCGACVEACQQQARKISGQIITAEEVVRQVLKDRLFHGKNGGVTLTGGEPLSQCEFSKAVLRRCKEAGIGTAMETSGFAPWESARSVYEECDYILHDIKQMDDTLHRKYTHVSNVKILEGIRRINNELGKELWLRLPLIPGYNDDEENYHRIGEFAAGLEHCTRIDILPYHKLGLGKLEQLEEEPEYQSYVPAAENVQKLQNILAIYRPDLFAENP